MKAGAIKRAITLLELVITIAVSSVIFVGVASLYAFLITTNTILNNDAQYFYSCNTLAHSIEAILDEEGASITDLPEFAVFDDPYEKNVSEIPEGTQKLFSFNKEGDTFHYYFFHQHFGYTNEEGSFTKLYVTESQMKLTIDRSTDDDRFIFTVYYGDAYKGSVSFTKKLSGGE